MSAFLTLDSISASTPDRQQLFEGLSLSVGAERIGLVGRNGAGKSTLLRIIAGQIEPGAGTVRRSGSVGFLRQFQRSDETVAQALGVADAMAVLGRILAGTGSAADFDAADWSLESRIEAALAEIALPHIALDRPVRSLSGGERTRIAVARLLRAKPDLLLLDEPTNNLDGEGRALVASLVSGWDGGVIVASHDRELLEGMDRIVELTPVGIRTVGGGWSAFAEQRDAERARIAADLEKADAAVRNARRTAQRRHEIQARRDKAGRAFAAKRSEPKILLDARAGRAESSGAKVRKLGDGQVRDAEARAAEASAQVEVVAPLRISLPSTNLPSTAELLALRDVTLARGDRLLGPWTFDLRGPERIAITGANGAGKTSFLAVATGAIAPTGGSVRIADRGIAMLDQHAAMLDPGQSVIDNFRRLNPSLTVEAAHAACARFAFRNRRAEMDVGVLSGGERLRAALACVLAGEDPPALLVLDEPTNHLDIESVETLEQALGEYDGALLVVSHDRLFLENIGIDRRCDLGTGL